MARKPDYGIDSPGIVAGLLIAAALCFAAAQILPRLFQIHGNQTAEMHGVVFGPEMCARSRVRLL